MEYVLQVSGPYDTVLAAARFSEQRGLPAIALPDHYLLTRDAETSRTTPANDAFIQIAALARETTVLELVLLVAPITFRHPAVILKSAVTIDDLSGGRFALGVGTGWMDLEHEVFGFPYPAMGERFSMLEEGLAYLRAGLDPTHPGFSGERYRLRPFPLSPTPDGSIRLVVGGTGSQRTPQLAGRYADEYNAFPGPDLADRIERARRAASDAGRDPDRLRLSSTGQVTGADSEEELDGILEERAARAGITREQLDRSIARRHTPIATWERLREQMAEMERLGIERFYLQGRYDEVAATVILDRLRP